MQTNKKDASGALIPVNPLDSSTYDSSLTYTGAKAQDIYDALSKGSALSIARQTVAIGTGSSAIRSQSVAIGAQASAFGDQSVAIGANTRTLGSSSIAIGGDDLNSASGFYTGGPGVNQSEAAKLYKKLTGDDFVDTSAYYKKTSSGEGAVALGVQAQAEDLSAALGTRANASGQAATAVGTGADASKGGAVALGAGSTTDTDAVTPTGATIGVVNLAGKQVGTLKYDFAGAFAGNVEDVGRQVSVGNVGNERQIKNVAPGEISRISTDAINGSQLVSVVEGVVAHFDDTAAVVYTQPDGTRVKKAADGKWYPDTAFNPDGTLIAGAVEIDATDIITSVKSAAGSTTTPTTLTNVAPGAITDTSTDAVNGSQLKDALDNTASSLGGGATYNPVTNTWTNPTYNVTNVAGGTVNTAGNVGDALTNLNSYVNTGFDVQQRGTKVSTVTPGSKVNFVNGANTVAKISSASADVTTVTFDVDNQGVVNNAQLPVVYTNASGNPVYKQPDGTWNTAKDGSGTVVAPADIITSVQSAAGSTTAPTKLTNVADGTISATSKDAVNGSQLHGLADSIKTSIGGNTIINPDGSISTSDLGDTGEDNIDDALKYINNIATNANKGWKLSTNGGATATVAPDQTVDFSNTDGNLKIANTGSNVTVNLNKDLDLTAAGSVKAGQTTLNNDGVVINNADPSKVVSITGSGINAGNNKVTNVQDGLIADGSKDAVNGGQIKNIADSIKNSIGGNTIVNPDGSISTSDIGNTGENNIHDAIANVNTAATKAKTTVTQGTNIVVTQSANADGSTNYEVKTADNINFKNVTVSENVNVAGTVTANELKSGNTTINNAGLTINNSDPNKVVSVTDKGISAGNNKITNVAPGAISSTSTDAVNGSQLNATNNAFNTFLGGGATYNDNTKTYNAPTYVINNGSTTNSYNNVGDALGALNQADTTINTRIDVLGDQLEQSFRSTNNRIDDVEKMANAGVAAAMSLENAPYIAGKYTYAVGAAYHGGENAVGATLRRTADNGRWSLTGGIAAASHGDPSVRVGISGVID